MWATFQFVCFGWKSITIHKIHGALTIFSLEGIRFRSFHRWVCKLRFHRLAKKLVKFAAIREAEKNCRDDYFEWIWPQKKPRNKCGTKFNAESVSLLRAWISAYRCCRNRWSRAVYFTLSSMPAHQLNISIAMAQMFVSVKKLFPKLSRIYCQLNRFKPYKVWSINKLMVIWIIRKTI